jgi:hypothetical protein
MGNRAMGLSRGKRLVVGLRAPIAGTDGWERRPKAAGEMRTRAVARGARPTSQGRDMGHPILRRERNRRSFDFAQDDNFGELSKTNGERLTFPPMAVRLP